MTAKTSQHLANVLRGAGFTELAKRAEADEFHDFLSDDALCAVTLDNELSKIISLATEERVRIAARFIRDRHHKGEFDASKEESDEWAASPDGQDAMRRLARGE